MRAELSTKKNSMEKYNKGGLFENDNTINKS